MQKKNILFDLKGIWRPCKHVRQFDFLSDGTVSNRLISEKNLPPSRFSKGTSNSKMPLGEFVAARIKVFRFLLAENLVSMITAHALCRDNGHLILNYHGKMRRHGNLKDWDNFRNSGLLSAKSRKSWETHFSRWKLCAEHENLVYQVWFFYFDFQISYLY